MNTIAVLRPIFRISSQEGTTGGLIDWLITFVVIAAVVSFVVWLVTKFAGPPVIPEPFRWILWVIVAIALLVFIFASLGIAI